MQAYKLPLRWWRIRENGDVIMKRKGFLFLSLTLALACVGYTPVAATEPHTHDGWTELTQGVLDGKQQPLNGPYLLGDGQYYLTQDLQLTNSIIIAQDTAEKETEVTICLNGHNIEGVKHEGIDPRYFTNNQAAIVITSTIADDNIDREDGGKLTIQDCTSNQGSIRNHVHTTNSSPFVFGGGVLVAGVGSELVLEGGNIKDNTVKSRIPSTISGAGVAVVSNGVFTMTGGSISGNKLEHYTDWAEQVKDTQNGGGVAVCGGTFNFNGGTIAGNEAKYGGGVSVKDDRQFGNHVDGFDAVDSTFHMTGGIIENNSATSGGGVHFSSEARDGLVTLSGGEIRTNAATESGGGICISSGTIVNVTGTAIKENAAMAGGGASVSKGTLNMTNCTMTGNTASLGGGIDLFEGVINLGENGAITGNTSTSTNALSGGGVLMRGWYDVTLNVSDNATIAGNFHENNANKVDDNVFLQGNTVVTVAGALTGEIGVKQMFPSANDVGVGSTQYPTVTESDRSKFTSDNPIYTPVLTNRDTVILMQMELFDGTDKEQGYAPETINISTLGMFEDSDLGPDDGDGATTKIYSVMENTGRGTFDTDTKELNVSRVGTFTVQVLVEGNGALKMGTATLTITPKVIWAEGFAGVERGPIPGDLTVELDTTLANIPVYHPRSGALQVINGDIVNLNFADAYGEIQSTDYDDYKYYVKPDGSAFLPEFAFMVKGVKLTGEDSVNYIVVGAGGQVKINLAIPYVAWPAAEIGTYGDKLSTIALFGGKAIYKDASGYHEIKGRFAWAEDGDHTSVPNGCYGHEVQFIPTDDANLDMDCSVDHAGCPSYCTALAADRHVVTHVIQRASVEFTITGDRREYTGSEITPTIGFVKDGADPYLFSMDECVITYRKVGETSDTLHPTAVGTYIITAHFRPFNSTTPSYYRHAGTLESTHKDIGVLNIYSPEAPTPVHNLTFNGHEELNITDSQPEDIHILPALSDPAYIGWSHDDKFYEFGERFRMPDADAVLTPVSAPAKTCVVSGTVTGTDLDTSHNTLLSNIGISLMQGSEQLDTTETKADGTYSFNVAPGHYNLVVTRDQAFQTTELFYFYVADGTTTITKDISLPDIRQNSFLTVHAGMPEIVVHGLTELAKDNPTEENTIKMTIAQPDYDIDYNERLAWEQIVAEKGDDEFSKIKLFMDIQITERAGNETEDRLVSTLEDSLEFHLPLPAILQDKDNYKVYRYHDGAVQTLTTTPNAAGEKIVIDDGEHMSIYAKYFSVYAIGYEDDVYTPPSSYNPPSTTKPVKPVEPETPQLNRDDHIAYMQGYKTGDFMPESLITRAEATVMFSRLLTQTMEADAVYDVDFTDMDGTEWYANQVGYMVKHGLMSGYTDGRFGGNDSITRAEFAVLASRFDALAPSGSNYFSDVPDDFWAALSINSSVEKGWITGYTDGTFGPNESISRAEAVVLVNRVLERICDQDYVTDNLEELVHFTDLTTAHWAYYPIYEATNGHDYTKERVSTGVQETWTALLPKQ